MEKVKIRIEPITRKEALQRDQRLTEFFIQDDRLKETPEHGNYRHSIIQAKNSIDSTIRMNLA